MLGLDESTVDINTFFDPVIVGGRTQLHAAALAVRADRDDPKSFLRPEARSVPLLYKDAVLWEACCPPQI